MKILFVLTSHDKLGDTGKKTGFWLEEFAAPYYTFLDAGAEVVIASPAGGQPPLDPKSDAPDAQTDSTRRFKGDSAAQAALASSMKLADLSHDDFNAVFYPGGHGPLWDLANNRDSISLIEKTIASGKPLGLVCHAPGALRNAKASNGEPLVQGLKVTGFSNCEEMAVGLSDVVPFLLQDVLSEEGASYSAGPDWGVHVVEDGMLVTGQNPASSEEAARKVLALLKVAQPV